MSIDLPNLSILLDRVRSVYNVGSIFRSAESAGISKLYLCGYCAIPPHPKLDKTALGSTQHISWEHHCSALACVKYLLTQDVHLVALEPSVKATNIYQTTLHPNTCLILGHEQSGIDPNILDLSHEIVAIPHFGYKESLNVSIAAGIAIFEYRRKTLTRHE